MQPGVIIAIASVLGAVLLAFAIVSFGKKLRQRGVAELAKRYPSGGVLMSDTLALSHGGVRGNGLLALTNDELYFFCYQPERSLPIPIAAIREVSVVQVRSGGQNKPKSSALQVKFAAAAGEETAVWKVYPLNAWRDKLQSLVQR